MIWTCTFKVSKGWMTEVATAPEKPPIAKGANTFKNGLVFASMILSIAPKLFERRLTKLYNKQVGLIYDTEAVILIDLWIY